jgi:hypothetical protein
MPYYPGADIGGHRISCGPQFLLRRLCARRLSSPVVEAAMRHRREARQVGRHARLCDSSLRGEW